MVNQPTSVFELVILNFSQKHLTQKQSSNFSRAPATCVLKPWKWGRNHTNKQQMTCWSLFWKWIFMPTFVPLHGAIICAQSRNCLTKCLLDSMILSSLISSLAGLAALALAPKWLPSPSLLCQPRARMSEGTLADSLVFISPSRDAEVSQILNQLNMHSVTR